MYENVFNSIQVAAGNAKPWKDSFVRNINESDSETGNSDEDELVDDTDDDPDYHPGEQSFDDDILPGPSSSTSRSTSMKNPRLSRSVLVNPLDDAELLVGF